ncbi:MAG: hypothetical protein CMB53_04665 [Euryarchaeota archaeon]|nr:hypothetical protein [Euryarchaeota archaeon]
MGEGGALPLRSDITGRYSGPWPERLVFMACLASAVLVIPDASVFLEGFLGNYSLIGAVICASLIVPLIADLIIRVMYRLMGLRQ